MIVLHRSCLYFLRSSNVLTQYCVSFCIFCCTPAARAIATSSSDFGSAKGAVIAVVLVEGVCRTGRVELAQKLVLREWYSLHEWGRGSWEPGSEQNLGCSHMCR